MDFCSTECTFKVLTENTLSSAVIHGVTSLKKHCYATFVGYDYSPGEAMVIGERVKPLTMLGF